MGHQSSRLWRPRYSKVGKFTLPLCVNAGTPALGIYSDLEARMRNVLGLVAASTQKAKMIALASAVLSGLAFTPVIAAEREQVRSRACRKAALFRGPVLAQRIASQAPSVCGIPTCARPR